MKVTVLIENTSPEALLHEHGLALHIAYAGHSVLLDAGAKGGLVQNAAALGIDLAGIEAVVLSHGHYDHADGLPAFFAVNRTAKVYARPKVMEPQYHGSGETRRFIGVNPDIFTHYRERFDLDDGPREIFQGLHLIPDGVDHEQSLVAETGGGLVVMNSCCHAGAGVLVREILSQFPGQRVRVLVGGFHLMGGVGTSSLGVAPGIVKNLAHWLTDELGVEALYTGHCTGVPAYELLQAEAGEKLHHLTTGLAIAF